MRPTKKTILVFCEGEKTEPEYLEALRRLPEVRTTASVDIQIASESVGSVPLTLVRCAVDARHRSNEEHSEVDEVWCLFDVEWPLNHPNLEQALREAKEGGIHVAVSNPCFEIWLVLHHQDQTAFLNNAAISKIRRKLDGSTGKGLDGARYLPLRHDAVKRASKLSQMHEGNGTLFPHDNPSTGMYRLLASVDPSCS